MPITSVTSDPDSLSVTAIGEFPVPVARLWGAWADPRILERFWGPPTWPATFIRHDFAVGGRSLYYMTGPEGQTSYGYWEFEVIEPGRRFVVRDGFCGEDGVPDEAFPEGRMEVRFEATAGGSRFIAVGTSPDLESLERLVAMGMIEGLSSALAQLDEVLADLREQSRDLRAALEIIDDTHVVVVREVRGSITQVWRAHNEPALIRQWMLGPEGWTMPVCEIGEGRYRYEWENTASGERFGFEGELLEREPPRRSSSTERMIGAGGEGTVNELVLTPRPGGRTRIEVRISYPSKELRDIVLGTGMVDGMEASYARLEGVL